MMNESIERISQVVQNVDCIPRLENSPILNVCLSLINGILPLPNHLGIRPIDFSFAGMELKKHLNYFFDFGSTVSTTTFHVR